MPTSPATSLAGGVQAQPCESQREPGLLRAKIAARAASVVTAPRKKDLPRPTEAPYPSAWHSPRPLLRFVDETLAGLPSTQVIATARPAARSQLSSPLAGSASLGADVLLIAWALLLAFA